MPRQKFENNAKSTLSVAVTSNTQASLTLQTGHGARFPYLAVPDFFEVTLDDGTNIEVCKCIDRATDVLTVLRGQQGTTAQAAFAIGTKVELRLNRDTIRRIAYYEGNQMFLCRPITATASYQCNGLPVPTVTGSAAPFTIVDSNWKTTQPLVRHGSTNSAQTALRWVIPQPLINVGRGFRTKLRFSPFIVPNSSHFFFGWVNTTGAMNSVHPPSSLTSAIVLGWANAAQNTNLSIWRNDAAGSAVQLDLGSFFTCSSFAVFEMELSCVGSESRVDYVVRRLDISSIPDASSFWTTDIPPTSLFLSPYFQGVSMVASGMAIDFMGVVADT